ncbi:hypothetical protein ACPOL_6416 [Acidisarcina polymorpha]|uniref:Uncharacterized protein n=2 Tax=Acidobacteriaceae TaxID=204434 RepID=A0A4Q0STB8_9BACT|nr:hypothetical protein ACPOL_6416 [Acidisarcina polymorpha]RXH53907.1 hypothetical protein GRAN_5245 [Granulicella sibirica]
MLLIESELRDPDETQCAAERQSWVDEDTKSYSTTCLSDKTIYE